jgi:hypothetical protein
MRRVAVFAWVAAAVLGAAPSARAQAVQASPDATPAVSALWIEHELTFIYAGFTSYYSCLGLRDKVRTVLEQLGARPGFKVTARSCMNGQGPEWSPSVRIVAAFPAEATPELVAELAAGQPERELAARASGKPMVEATAQFPARWKRVEFRSGRLGDIQDGDCELMDQLRREVFGRIGVRVIEAEATCVPRQVTLGAVRMTVEVLEPVPSRDAPAG